MALHGSIVKTLAAFCCYAAGVSAQAFRFHQSGVFDRGICTGHRNTYIYTGTQPNVCTNFPLVVAAVSPEYVIPNSLTGITVYKGRNCQGDSMRIPNHVPAIICARDTDEWASVSYGFAANGRRDDYNETETLDKRAGAGYQPISTDPSAWDYWNGKSGSSDQWLNPGTVIQSRSNEGLAEDMANAIGAVWSALDDLGSPDSMVGSFTKNVDVPSVAMTVQTAMVGGKKIKLNSLKFLIADQLTWNKIQRKCAQLVIPVVVAGSTIGTLTIFGF